MTLRAGTVKLLVTSRLGGRMMFQRFRVRDTPRARIPVRQIVVIHRARHNITEEELSQRSGVTGVPVAAPMEGNRVLHCWAMRRVKTIAPVGMYDTHASDKTHTVER